MRIAFTSSKRELLELSRVLFQFDFSVVQGPKEDKSCNVLILENALLLFTGACQFIVGGNGQASSIKYRAVYQSTFPSVKGSMKRTRPTLLAYLIGMRAVSTVTCIRSEVFSSCHSGKLLSKVQIYLTIYLQSDFLQ